MKEAYIQALDEFFAAHYSDYVKLAALEGYRRPELLTVDRDGNIGRKRQFLSAPFLSGGVRDAARDAEGGPRRYDVRLHLPLPHLPREVHDLFDKYTFARHLPAILSHCGETPESAGKKLSLLPEVWQGIVKGKLYPEKNTVLALALVCHIRPQDANSLLVLSGFSFDLRACATWWWSTCWSASSSIPRCATAASESTVSRICPLRKGCEEFAANRSLREIFAARGEQALSCKKPGGLFAACELGNAPLFGAFPDRARASTAREESLLILRGGFGRARRWIAEGKTDGSLRLHAACPYNPPASLRSAPSLTQGGQKRQLLPPRIRSAPPSKREAGKTAAKHLTERARVC